MTTIDRMNALTRESVETAFDAAAAIQRQNVQIFQTWLSVVETGQQTLRDLSLRTMRQTQEAQSLWVELAQESVRTGVENATNLAQSGLREAGEGLDRASRANGSRIETPTA